MESKMNGAVTYLALQRLVEQAWDDGDGARLAMLSQAVDGIATRLIDGIDAGKKAG